MRFAKWRRSSPPVAFRCWSAAPGLYFRALQYGLSDLPQADPDIRDRLAEEAASIGWAALHARLAELDPVAAARIGISDTQRIQRALEVIELTGKPMSAQQSAPPAPFGYRVLKLALLPENRAALARAHRRTFRCDARRRLSRRSRAAEIASRSASGSAGDPRRRLPPGLAASGWCFRCRRTAQLRHFRHAPARQTPDHLAALRTRCARVRSRYRRATAHLPNAPSGISCSRP